MGLILGCSPFVAARQFGDRSTDYRVRFKSGEAIAEVWQAWADAGGRALHLVDDPFLLDAYARWNGRSVMDQVWLTVGQDVWEPIIDRAVELGITAVLRHARQVDSGEPLGAFLGAATRIGLLAGATTHAPRNLFDVPRNLPPEAPLLLPYNYAGLHMDASPEVLRELLTHRRPPMAMMTLGAGRLPFASGIGYAALLTPWILVGTGSALRAAALASWDEAIATLALPGHRVARVPHDVDVSEGSDDVLFLRNHDALRLASGARALWRQLNEPRTLDELTAWVSAHSGWSIERARAEVAGTLLQLHRWRLVEVQ